LFGGAVPGRGDGSWKIQVPTGSGNATLSVDATFSTNWRQANHSFVNGTPECSRRTTATLSDANQPSLLIRRITFSYELFGERQAAAFENTEAYPAVDIYRDQRGGVVVRTKTSDLTILKVQTAGNSSPATVLHRIPIPCGDPSDIVDVWFPYLVPGSYDISDDRGVLTQVQVTAGAVTIVNCQSGRACTRA
jgi:hypothetical protein